MGAAGAVGATEEGRRRVHPSGSTARRVPRQDGCTVQKKTILERIFETIDGFLNNSRKYQICLYIGQGSTIMSLSAYGETL